MDRRNFVQLLCASGICASWAVTAQPAGTVRKIGILNALARTEPLPQTFLRSLAEVGYVDGQSATIEYRSGTRNSLPALADELVRLNVDLIFAVSLEAALAARGATKSIPIVFLVIGDPVRVGLVESLGRPGGNATGISETGSDLGGKRLELLKEMKPGISNIGVLWNPDNPGTTLDSPVAGKSERAPILRQIEEAGRTRGIKVRPFAVRNPDDFPGAFDAATRARVDALVVEEGPLMYMERTRIVEFAAAKHLPAIYGVREFVILGGLISYGPDLPDLLRRIANYIDRILKGAKPRDLPVEQPTKLDLVVNRKTAKALGLIVPQSILIRANDVIQ